MPSSWPSPALQKNVSAENDAARHELMYRAFALPAALLAAQFLVRTGFRTAVRMLTMILHESGHAIAAWLTGRWAVPLLWVTLRGEERSFTVVLTLTATIVFVGFRAWIARSWPWVTAAGAMLTLQLLCVTAWNPYAESLIVFWGDGGAMVLATILMALFYSGPKSAIGKNGGLRWGLLAVGALAFFDVYSTWSGPWGDLPFGEQEGVGLSDPSVLTEMIGWSVPFMVDRYLLVAKLCLRSLAVLYIWGLISAYLKMRHPASRASSS